MEFPVVISACLKQFSVHEIDCNGRAFHDKASEELSVFPAAEMRQGIGLENDVRKLVVKHLVADRAEVLRTDLVGNVSKR